MPPQRNAPDAKYTRSQEHHHLHHILESIARYNRCNGRSRRLMLVHVDEKEDDRIIGAFGTPSMVGCALSSGLCSTLADFQTSLVTEKESNYLPYVCVPEMEVFEDAPAEALKADIMDLMSHISWPNCEVFTYERPLGWPATVPFIPLYQCTHDPETLLDIHHSLLRAYYARMLDIGICVHSTGCADDVHHFGRCESMARAVQSLLENPNYSGDRNIRFTDHRMHVGCRGVGFELEKKAKEVLKAEPKAETKKKRKRPGMREDSPDPETQLYMQIRSLRRRNAYSLFVAQNYAKVDGTFAERQKKLGELWKTADQKMYTVKLQRKRLEEYQNIMKARRADTALKVEAVPVRSAVESRERSKTVQTLDQKTYKVNLQTKLFETEPESLRSPHAGISSVKVEVEDM